MLRVLVSTLSSPCLLGVVWLLMNPLAGYVIWVWVCLPLSSCSLSVLSVHSLLSMHSISIGLCLCDMIVIVSGLCMCMRSCSYSCSSIGVVVWSCTSMSMFTNSILSSLSMRRNTSSATISIGIVISIDIRLIYLEAGPSGRSNPERPIS